LTDEAVSALRRVRAPRHAQTLEDLLETSELRGLEERAEALANKGSYDI
jgi:hypothetical protein